MGVALSHAGGRDFGVDDVHAEPVSANYRQADADEAEDDGPHDEFEGGGAFFDAPEDEQRPQERQQFRHDGVNQVFLQAVHEGFFDAFDVAHQLQSGFEADVARGHRADDGQADDGGGMAQFARLFFEVGDRRDAHFVAVVGQTEAQREVNDVEEGEEEDWPQP